MCVTDEVNDGRLGWVATKSRASHRRAREKKKKKRREQLNKSGEKERTYDKEKKEKFEVLGYACFRFKGWGGSDVTKQRARRRREKDQEKGEESKKHV